MNAPSHEFDLAQATMLPPASPAGPCSVTDLEVLTEQWEAVHDAAGAIAALAQLAHEPLAPEIAALPRRAARIGGSTYEMTAHGIEDLAAFMQPGLRALLALTAKGQDTTAAALTLWREFHTARTALLELSEAG
ncbi:hypothetical protein [Qipengyuania mesophila]|uniref:hypothetical protein n=1 Tax=Qipengyuania mesophila TaxID=2867246 RepID=UPI00351894B0